MQTKRIIPCLDVAGGRVVKGIQFEELRDAGDPAECARLYEAQGADELAMLDITATVEGRDTFTELVDRVSRQISIPLTIGGGIRRLADIERILTAGADKVSIGTAAVENPMLIQEAAERFGSGRLVAAIDVALMPDGSYHVFTRGGRTDTSLLALEWAKQAEALGVGEILLTSKTCDGQKSGYDLVITRQISDAVGIPVIASGGAGTKEHFKEALTTGGADAALAASLFHFREITIPELKAYLRAEGIAVR